jgi:hypothetical protein
MLSIKSISVACSALALCISTVQAGQWFDLMQKGKVEEAESRAYFKCYHYAENDPSLDQHEEITKYINQYLPNLNRETTNGGIFIFFREKILKWEGRRIGAQACFDKTLNPDYEEELKAAVSKFASLSFQHQAINALKEIRLHVKSQKKTSGSSSFENTVENLLKVMKIGKDVQRLQQLHENLNEKLKKLMGIEAEQMSKPFKKPSIVSVIDIDFTKDIHGKPPYGIEFQDNVPQRQEGAHLSLALNYGHGDFMVDLVKTFSPQSEIVRSIAQCLKNFCSSNEPHKDSSRASIVFNCSWNPLAPHTRLQKDGPEIQWSFLDRSVDLYKSSLKKEFPDKNADGPLDREQLEFLQNLENMELIQIPYPFLARSLVLPEKKRGTSHLLIAAPDNSPGPLVKEEFHNGRIRLLDDDDTKKYALVALNYDIMTGDLVTSSKSAGEYKDMAVAVPATYVSHMDQSRGPIPLFSSTGGHSSASAILSAVISSVHGYYPELTAKEVKMAILRGADKTFAGYQEERHGQGMLNLKGALAVAEKILSSPNRNRPLPPLPAAKNPNRNRPLPTPPVKK